MTTRIILNYLHPDADPDEYDQIGNETCEGFPTCVNAESYPYFHIELVLNDGWAAGAAWMIFIVIDCIDPQMVGKELCCAADPDEGGYWCEYQAEVAWDDGFISNTSDENLPYREGGGDSEGTPMGGEVVERLDGMTFHCPEALIDELNNQE